MSHEDLPFPDPQFVMVEIAFGADPNGDPNDWVWVDVTADLKHLDGVVGRIGRNDEESSITTFQWRFTLDDTRGEYTPDFVLSPHYPNVKLGAPVRLTPLIEDGGSGDFPLGVGQVAEWTPEWPEGDLSDAGVVVATSEPETDSSGGGDDPGYARVVVVVAGVLRRLQQGQEPVGSALARSVPMLDAVIEYWPMEEQARTSVVKTAFPERSLDGEIDPDSGFGASTLWAGSLGLPRQSSGDSGWSLPVRNYPLGTTDDLFRVDFLFSVDAPPTLNGTPGETTVIDVTSSVGFYRTYRLIVSAALSGDVFSVFRLYAITFAGSSSLVASDTFRIEQGFGTPLRIEFIHSWIAGTTTLDVDASLFLTPADGDEELLATMSFNEVAGGRNFHPYEVSHPGVSEQDSALSWGHVVVSVPQTANPFQSAAVQGFFRERAGRRFLRLCSEEGVAAQVIGDPDATTQMAPQTASTFLNNLNAVEAADGGIWSEARNELGFTYRTFLDLVNQTEALRLDASPHDREPDVTIPYAPTLDDRNARNDIEAIGAGDASIRVRDEDDIQSRGRYPDSRSYPLATEDLVNDRASFDLLRGTWPGMRVRQIRPAIEQKYDLARPWHELFQGDLIEVDGLPPQHSPIPVELLLRGRATRIGPYTWGETGNTEAAGPYRLGVVGGSGDPDALPTRYDSSRSYLFEEVSDAATALNVYVPTQRPVVPNSGFESSDLSVWQEITNGALQRSQRHVFRGATSGLFTPMSGGVSAFGSSTGRIYLRPASADFTYQFSVWLFSDVGGFDVALQYSTYRAAGITTGTPVTVPSAEWVRLYAEQTSPDPNAPPTDNELFIGIVYDDNNETAPVWVDDLEMGWHGQPWVDNATFPAEFPFDIVIGGERMRVTGATAPDATRLQTLTVTRGLDGFSVPHDAGQAVRLSAPLRFAPDPT